MNNKDKKNNSLEKITVIELCSGIGAQIKGINNTHLFNANMIATADLDKEVVVSYAAIHCGLTNEMIENYEDYPTKEEMVKQLTDKRIGYDFKKNMSYDWRKLSHKKDKTKGIEKYWLADHVSHNLGDITKIKMLPYCDLLTYSTPCTDLSIAGEQKGLNWTCCDCGYEYNPAKLNVNDRYICPNCKGENIKSTRSGLLYEVERLLVKAKEINKLPKYLFMENVDALVSSKYINSFKDWLNRLESIGYNSYYQTINAKNTGIPQNRNRIFCVSIRKDIDTKLFEFPKPFDLGIRLNDLLETDDDVLEKYFLSDKVQKRFRVTDPKFEKNIVGTTKPEFRTIGQRDLCYKEDSIIGTLVATDYKQPKQIFVGKLNKVDNELIKEKNLKIVRKLTPKEVHRLMGFDDVDFDNCKAVGMSDSQGYKQAGNSIVTTVISLLIEHLYKAQYDNTYICADEKIVNRQLQAETFVNNDRVIIDDIYKNRDIRIYRDYCPCLRAERSGLKIGSYKI